MVEGCINEDATTYQVGDDDPIPGEFISLHGYVN